MFADIEAAVITALAALPGVTRVSTTTPADLAGSLPMIQVQRVGGADDLVTDTARVDVQTFTPTDPTNPNRGSAIQLAERVRAAVHALRHTAVGAVVIDTAETVVAPQWVDYADEHVTRFVGTYEFTLRAPSA